MSINIEKLKQLNDKVSLSFRRKHIIVLNPADKQENEDSTNADIEYDKTEWKIPNKVI